MDIQYILFKRFFDNINVLYLIQANQKKLRV